MNTKNDGMMGTRDEAYAALIAKARKWRELRQPIIADRRELREIDREERQVRFELANAALLWLWHEENTPPVSGRA